MHYTMQSGIATVRMTSRCPMCLAVKVHTDPSCTLDDQSVCCSEECYAKYHADLMALAAKATAWVGTLPPWSRPSVWDIVARYITEGDYY